MTSTDTNAPRTINQLNEEQQEIEKQIAAFNSHWLNHEHLVSGFAVLVMALIFLGMLIPSLEITVWSLCGIQTVTLAGVMVWRRKIANDLNEQMQSIQQAIKVKKRSRRKK
ncbi:protein of unknown function [Pseudodesulfovibrio profundus]|uniref:Uncharacterized protein n=1 Tax=Pseudodesulfovibrio profundus TaxID=57320 RepID=A0A2C8FBQ7_9BACT|nr:hypothetical protein [Pseudodesulfovibrio profundus]SOB59875.1 protein of unknown function [Pseudodesulfovibrio profundus]